MVSPKPLRLSVEDYLAWEATQEDKHELIDGRAVPRRDRVAAGGTGRHALIASRLISSLYPRLRGGPCAPYGSDLKVYSPSGSFRYPDVTVDGSPKTGRATFAQDPRVSPPPRQGPPRRRPRPKAAKATASAGFETLNRAMAVKSRPKGNPDGKAERAGISIPAL